MSRTRPWIVLTLCVAGLALAGCGGTSLPPAVHISVTAPVDGATVAVRGITVFGTVTPSSASLRVAGRRVRVRHGSFSVPITLRRRLTQIRITARAPGYHSDATDVMVTYQAGARAARPRASRGAGTPAATDALFNDLASAGFLSSCSGNGGDIGGCACAWHYLVAHGITSPQRWLGLAQAWRQSVQTGASYPPLMVSTVKACRSAFRAG